MKSRKIILLALIISSNLAASTITSIQEFDVKPGNSPAINKANLQKAIDRASASGSALFVEPSEEPYHIDGGIILKRNVSLVGVHGPTPRGTTHPSKDQPVGSVFKIRRISSILSFEMLDSLISSLAIRRSSI